MLPLVNLTLDLTFAPLVILVQHYFSTKLDLTDRLADRLTDRRTPEYNT